MHEYILRLECTEIYFSICLGIHLLTIIATYFQGAELAAQEGQSAAALAACRTLAEELSEQRFPAPRILSFKVSLLVLILHCYF